MKKYMTAFFIIVSLCSCRILPLLYRPADLNMPLPSQKKEFKAKIYCGAANGLGLNASYAVGSHCLVMASGSTLSLLDNSQRQKSKNFIVDAGGGIFTNIGKYGRAELLGSLGYADTRTETWNDIWKGWTDTKGTEHLAIDAGLYRAAVQADIGLVIWNFNVAFGGRLIENYTDGYYTATYTDSNKKFLNQLDIPIKGYSLFFEPGIMVSIGDEKVKVEFQGGLSYRLNGVKPVENFGELYLPYFISLGLHVNLGNGFNN